MMQQLLQRHVVAREVFERQIDAVAFRIFGNVTEDIGELEGNAGLFGEFFGARIGIAEDADTDQPYDRSDQVAVTIEIGKVCVGVGASRIVAASRSIVVPATSSSSRLMGNLKA